MKPACAREPRTPKLRRTTRDTPAYVMTCGGIQNESRPMRTCHWISHPTPQLASIFAARRAQSAARRKASTSVVGVVPTDVASGRAGVSVARHPPSRRGAIGRRRTRRAVSVEWTTAPPIVPGPKRSHRYVAEAETGGSLGDGRSPRRRGPSWRSGQSSAIDRGTFSPRTRSRGHVGSGEGTPGKARDPVGPPGHPGAGGSPGADSGDRRGVPLGEVISPPAASETPLRP